jgi:hypothetical protein
MSNENYIIKNEKSYYNKCDIIKEHFLKDVNFKNKKPNIAQINKSLKEILFLFCNVNEDNEMIIDYRYFKLLESINGLDKDYIIKYVMNNISIILKKQEHFVVHLCLHSLTLSDLEKHYTFMYKISEMLKTSFPDNLEKCFIYKAPFIFSQFFSVISTFVDKKTLAKVELIA